MSQAIVSESNSLQSKLVGRRVLFLTTNLNTDYLAVGTKHISSWLAHQGAKVSIVAAPRLFRRPQQGTDYQEWKTAQGVSISQYEPRSILPYRLFRGTTLGRKAFGWQLSLANKSFRRILASDWDLILLDDPIFSFAAPGAKSNAIRVYRPTDVYSMMKGGDVWDAIDREIIAGSDWIVAMGAKTRDHMLNLGTKQDRLLLMENGVDFSQFRAARAGTSELFDRFPGRKIALWVGVIDGRFNVDLLREVARKRRDWIFVIVGPVSIQVTDLSDSNVVWLGQRRHAEIPSLMRDCSIGIMPLSAHPANACRSPMKLYEYLASGKAVVSGTTEELRKRSEPGIFLADNPEQFAEKMDEAYAWSDSAALVQAAEKQDWPGKCISVFTHILERHRPLA